jgi:hypothetical protein
MNHSPFSSNALNTALAALAGVAAATVVKLLLDETTEATAPTATAPTGFGQAGRYHPARRAKLQELAAAARDPLYLADMQEVNDDFAFVDAENL